MFVNPRDLSFRYYGSMRRRSPLGIRPRTMTLITPQDQAMRSAVRAVAEGTLQLKLCFVWRCGDAQLEQRKPGVAVEQGLEEALVFVLLVQMRMAALQMPLFGVSFASRRLTSR